MTMKVPTNELTILISNPTSHKIALVKSTPVAYIEDTIQEIILYTCEKEETQDDIYKYRTKEDILERLRANAMKLNLQLFDINPQLTEEQKIYKWANCSTNIETYSRTERTSVTSETISTK